MWVIFIKSLFNLLHYCFYFMFWFSGPKACGIIAPQPEMEPPPPALEGEGLTTGLPGKAYLPFTSFALTNLPFSKEKASFQL